ncbi:hypothetical protein AB0M28_18425 [Streptomyces sp. NPDC051940]|uniref:hypothetical protein n=1 Tax=Streptomyces sp. NPDC051940 TaxID=3155675 RepID=UPI00342F3BA8
MITRTRRTVIPAALGALLLLGGAACGSDDGSGSGSGAGSGTEVSITSPADDGSISIPFTLKVDASEELGTTDSGKHHVHLYFDGDDQKYEVVEEASHEITAESPAVAGLTPGEHTLNVSLRNADHSPAGAEDEITVTVGEGGAQPSASGDTGGGDDGGYGY